MGWLHDETGLDRDAANHVPLPPLSHLKRAAHVFPDHRMTHCGGAPIVPNMLINAPDEDRRPLDHTVEVFTAGTPPAPATLEAIEPLGFNVTQTYGLTETYGHVTECPWREEWDGLPRDQRSAIKARTGLPMPMKEDSDMRAPRTMRPAPGDGLALARRTGGETPVQEGFADVPGNPTGRFRMCALPARARELARA